MKQRIVKINNIDNINQELIGLAVNTLQNHGLVIFPSDTVYGIFARADRQGIRKVDELKNRLPGKNYSLIVSDLAQLKLLVEIDKKSEIVISKNTPGFFTFIVKPLKILKEDINYLIIREGKLGFRIPTSKFMRLVASKSSFPVLATSANLSGQPAVYKISDLKKQLGDKINSCDLIIDSKNQKSNQPSTVIDLTSDNKILRKGDENLK